MNLKTVSLSAAGGDPTLEIAFGFAQHGQYRLYIWNADGQSPRLIGQGVSTDNNPDVFAIGERIAAARQRVEAEGGRWGRPRRMDDAQVKRAAALRRTGLSVRQVADRMGLPKSTVERVLRAG